MASDRIERETLIEAPPEVVWEVLTEPGHIGGWWGAAAAIDMRPGGQGTLSWQESDTTVALRVEVVERPRVLSFRWVYPKDVEPQEGNSLLVQFTLQPEGDRTRLRVIESGLSKLDWSDDRKAAYLGDHEPGWDRRLSQLAARAVAQVRAPA